MLDSTSSGYSYNDETKECSLYFGAKKVKFTLADTDEAFNSASQLKSLMDYCFHAGKVDLSKEIKSQLNYK